MPLAGHVDHEAGLERRGRRPRRRRRPSASVDADHQAAAAHLGDAVERLEPVAKRSPSSRDARAAAPGRRSPRAPPAPRAAATGPPAKVEPWSPRLEHVAELGRGDAGADRQAAAERLGGGHHVGPHRQLLVGPERSRSAPSRSGPRRRRAAAPAASQASRAATSTSSAIGKTPASPWIGSIITAAVRSPTAARSASGSSRGTATKPARQRPEEVVAGEPRRRRERAQRAAVEGAVEDDDLGLVDAARRGRACGPA